MENNNEGDSAIAKFFEGRSVFITGATGFMGKVSDYTEEKKYSEVPDQLN